MLSYAEPNSWTASKAAGQSLPDRFTYSGFDFDVQEPLA
jgi:hypothetical protein